MRLALLLLVLLLGAGPGCRSKDAPAPVASSTLAEVPAPKELLAELSLGNPKDTWQRLRLLGGDAAQVLPSSLAVLLATSLSLPPAAAGNLDEGLPMVGALLARADVAEPDVVLGMHVLSGAELVASLTLGDGAKFRQLELGPRLVRLLPAPGAPELNGALAVSGNYLLVATRVEALARAGRFVAETLPRRAKNEPGLRLRAGEQVLSGSIAQVLRRAWQAKRAALAARDRAERQAKGRAPDFADPEVLLAGIDGMLESWLGVLESSRELSLEVVPESDRLRAELSLAPSPDGAAALLARELVVGSIAPLLQMPASTRAALLMRGSQQAGPEPQPGLGAALARLFGERLRPEQGERLTKAFDALARSQRGANVVGLVAAPAPALLVQSELVDGPAFTSSVGDVLGLLELPPVGNWLAGVVGKPTLSISRAQSGLSSARLRFRTSGAAPSLPIPTDLRIAWEARDGVGHLVVSPDAGLAPAALAEGPRLGASTWLSKSQAQLGDSAALAIYAEAGLLLGARSAGGSAAEDAKVLLALAKRGERIAFSLEAAPGALRALSGAFR